MSAGVAVFVFLCKKFRKNSQRINQALSKRVPQHGANELFIARHSPRAMSGQPLTEQELMAMFEAARFAPSSFNNQPWRFVYVLKGQPAWQEVFDLLNDFNKSWATGAGALVVVISHNIFQATGQPSKTHSYDTGAATQNFALQGFLMGLNVRGIEGFDYEKARTLLGVPQDYTVEVMFAVGYPAPVTVLPASMHHKEVITHRKPLEELVFQGQFTQKKG